MEYKMQISLNVSPELHQQISSTAEYLEKSIEDYIIERLSEPDEVQALKELDDFLESRVISANQGNFVDKTATEIMNEAVQKRLSEKCLSTK